jgi:hypothetical protein
LERDQREKPVPTFRIPLQGEGIDGRPEGGATTPPFS